MVASFRKILDPLLTYTISSRDDTHGRNYGGATGQRYAPERVPNKFKDRLSGTSKKVKRPIFDYRA